MFNIGVNLDNLECEIVSTSIPNEYRCQDLKLHKAINREDTLIQLNVSFSKYVREKKDDSFPVIYIDLWLSQSTWMELKYVSSKDRNIWYYLNETCISHPNPKELRVTNKRFAYEKFNVFTVTLESFIKDNGIEKDGRIHTYIFSE
jgi:hypothetical protein